MTSKHAAEACFNIADIILFIAAFIDSSDKTTLSYFSRTNRCTYISLEQERGRIISCHVVNVPSLSLFLNQQLLRHEQLNCRSLEIIGDEGLRFDSNEVELHSTLVSITRVIGENRPLDEFAYRNPDETYHQLTLCPPPELWDVLQLSSGNLKILNVNSNVCNWDSLFASDFIELKSLQLTLNFSDPRKTCNNGNIYPKNIPISNDLSRFLRSMQHLTSLVLFLRDNNFKSLIMTDIYLPALIAVDIYSTAPPPGLIPFVADHSNLEHLRFKFRDAGRRPMSFQAQDLPKLRALKTGMDLQRIFSNILGEVGNGDTEKAEELRARRPHLEHLFIDCIYSFRDLKSYVWPFRRQLRRLDLKNYGEAPILRNGFYKMLESFTALIELSIILTGCKSVIKRGKELSTMELRNILGALEECASFRAIHLFDVASSPLAVSDLQNLQPVPRSLQYIYWGSRDHKATFRVLHDPESQSAHAVVCKVPPPPHEIVTDWTSKNTFRHLFNL